MSNTRKLNERLTKLEGELTKESSEKVVKASLAAIFQQHPDAKTARKYFERCGCDERLIRGLFFMARRYDIIPTDFYP